MPTGDHRRIRASARAEFDRWARTYDRSLLNEVVFFPAMRACQEEIVRWRSRGGSAAFELLDVGCGTGTLLTLLARRPDAKRLVGLDYSPRMIRHATRKLACADGAVRRRVRFVVGDSERLPLADASFDVLTCCHSFHHYPHQLLVIREFGRVLRPGGVLILIDGFRDNVIGWVIYDVCVATIERSVHHASWSSVRDMLRAAGFAQVAQRKLGVLAPLLVSVGTR